MLSLPPHLATRYVQPLREGGSLPAVVDVEERGLFVVKFRGAGQGPRALIAELLVGLLAREAGLPVPELAIVEVPEGFGAGEPDPEIRELLERSVGVNVGLRYLDGAFNYDARAAGDLLDADFAARLVWFDAFVTNPDRTARNPNLMVWERRPWLIDHGSAIYFHHAWAAADGGAGGMGGPGDPAGASRPGGVGGPGDDAKAAAPFALIEQHVLLPLAGDLEQADAALAAALTEERIDAALEAVPDALLLDPLARGGAATVDAVRERYRRWFAARLKSPRAWVAAAEAARRRKRVEVPQRLGVRR